MKILLVSPFENSASGRNDRNMKLATSLRARGHEVIYVTGNFDHARKTHIPKDTLFSGARLKVLKLPGYKKNVSIARLLCNFSFAVKLWFWAFGQKWDVVVVSSIPPEVLLAATLLRRRALVVDIRDIWPDALKAYGSQTFSIRLFSAYCDLIYRATLKHVDRIMVVAPGFRTWLRRYVSLSPRLVKLVPLGFRREDFRPLSDGGKDFDFCYAGGLTPQFDIREFALQFGTKKGVVLGSGPMLDSWMKAFPNTIFRGVVPRPEAILMMGQARKLLFPSNPYAQLPNKAFDYFALGHQVEFGMNCTRATRYLLELRRRRKIGPQESWRSYRSLEKEAVTNRASDIVEGVIT